MSHTGSSLNRWTDFSGVRGIYDPIIPCTVGVSLLVAINSTTNAEQRSSLSPVARSLQPCGRFLILLGPVLRVHQNYLQNTPLTADGLHVVDSETFSGPRQPTPRTRLNHFRDCWLIRRYLHGKLTADFFALFRRKDHQKQSRVSFQSSQRSWTRYDVCPTLLVMHPYA